MATSVNQRAFEAKSKVLDELEEEFKEKLHEFTSNVKSTIQTVQEAAAIQCFEMAVTFLTQAFPNMTDSGANGSVDEISKITSELQNMKRSQNQMSNKVTKLTTNNQKFKDKVEELNEKVFTNKTHIQGLRKFQRIFESKSGASQVPAAAAAAAAMAPGPIQSLRQRTTFSCKIHSDNKRPDVFDIKLLPCNLILLADSNNNCVKLFDTQGQYISTGFFSTFPPRRIAVMDRTSNNSWAVAVTFPDCSTIEMLKVTTAGIKHQKTLSTSPYYAIAAIDPKTLAVGYVNGAGIDIINLSGHVLRQISLSTNPSYMEATPDQCLVITHKSLNIIVKLKIADGKIVHSLTVPQMKNPRGITRHHDGTCVVSDKKSGTLHLYNTGRGWLKTLWCHPAAHIMSGVSLFNGTCVCSTYNGSVFVMDVL
ncbi:hypothetical protein RRG08_006447 [Elysia crispata]|uniref:Uncharacterized protein n=1 Tax=Elysia crispata TaxID=231223 RepID=A0AAE0YZL6_9GAST|nr:hypothetical protein RRG08_006447 [Elysia crispata]